MEKILSILLLLIVLLILLLNYSNINKYKENYIDLNNMKDNLISVINNSNSVQLVKDIGENMYGSTMHHHYHILYDIRTLLGHDKKIYTEIGSYNGGSLSLMLNHGYETECNCIDPLHLKRTDRSIIEKNIVKYNKNNYDVKIWQKFSTDPQFLEQLDKINFKTDILFIDGDHSYDTVIKDFNNFEKYVNSGGYIVFDDYEDWKYSPEVKLAVNDIVKNIDHKKYNIIGNLDNIKNAHDTLNLKKLNEYILLKKIPKLLILLNCFFNHELINRTLKSIKETNFYCDIIFLENPSKYSDEINKLGVQYKIYKHYICDENIEGNIFTLFIKNFKNIINNYDYIGLSEADVVLEKDSLDEAIQILDMNDNSIGNISIDLDLNYEKYNELPLNTWINPPKIIENYKVGPTGYQFIIFKRDFLYDFIETLDKKIIFSKVALGVEKYYGLSDSNLSLFNEYRKKLWIRTNKTKLDHIGWELYLKINENNEYVKFKNENISNKKIRENLNIDKNKLLLISY